MKPNWQRREAIWSHYQATFADLPIGLPVEAEAETRHAYHLYTIQVDPERCGIERDAFLDTMTAARIGVGVHYLSVPEHPYYQQRFGWRPEQWPNAMRIGRQTLSLPISPKLSDADVERVVAATNLLVLC